MAEPLDLEQLDAMSGQLHRTEAGLEFWTESPVRGQPETYLLIPSARDVPAAWKDQALVACKDLIQQFIATIPERQTHQPIPSPAAISGFIQVAWYRGYEAGQRGQGRA